MARTCTLTKVCVFVDPRVADYFMMSSPWASLVICVLYVIVVQWALPRFMDSRKPLEFRPVIVAYNFAMVVLSGYIFVEVCKHSFDYLLKLCMFIRLGYNETQLCLLSLC